MGLCVLDGLHDWAVLGRADTKTALCDQLAVALVPVGG
jgi:hypothetical protein